MSQTWIIEDAGTGDPMWKEERHLIRRFRLTKGQVGARVSVGL